MMKKYLLLCLMIGCSFSAAFAQGLHFRILPDSCVRLLCSDGQQLYAMSQSAGKVNSHPLLRSMDQGRSWTEMCVPVLNSTVDSNGVTLYEQVDCLSMNDSVLYYALGTTTDDFLKFNSAGRLGRCSNPYAVQTFEFPWVISSLVMQGSFIACSGWTDIPEQLMYSTDNGLLWQRVPYDVLKSNDMRLCLQGKVLYCAPSWGDSIFVSADSAKSFVQRPRPSPGNRPVALLSGPNGRLIYISEQYSPTKTSKVFESTDSAQSWQQLFETESIPLVESAAFVHDTLLLHPVSSCTVVGVGEQIPVAEMSVTLRNNLLIIKGGNEHGNASVITLFDMIGRQIARVTRDDQSAAFIVSVPELSSPYCIVSSSEGWARLVEVVR